MPYSLSLALGAAAVVLLLAPLTARLAWRIGAVAQPGPRHVHREPMPTLGGLAMVVAVLGVAWLARALPGPAGLLEPWPLVGLTLASVPIVLLGVYDDVRGASPWWKLGVQAASALILWLSGIGIPLLTNPFGGSVETGWLGLPLTLLWVLAVTNAINLIDGLDGLAAGVVAIVAASLWWTARTHADLYVMFICALTIGATLGFLRYNFPPARQFMGDTGSQFLGLTLAAVTLLENRKGTATVSLLFPLVALILPIADSAFAFLRRAARGHHVFRGDDQHIHHRLLRLGLSPRATTLLLWGVSAVCGLMAVAFSLLPRGPAVLAVLVLAAALVAVFRVVAHLARRRPA